MQPENGARAPRHLHAILQVCSPSAYAPRVLLPMYGGQGHRLHAICQAPWNLFIPHARIHVPISQPVLLRRTKRTIIDGRPLLSLPEKRIELTTLTFSKQEEEFYQQLEAEAKTEFQVGAAGNEWGATSPEPSCSLRCIDVGHQAPRPCPLFLPKQRAQSEADPTRFNVLSMLQQLLRLRQACDHPQLVRNARSDFATYTPEEVGLECMGLLE